MTARIALHLDGDLAHRVKNVLLGMPDTQLGGPLFGQAPSPSAVAGWDALVVQAVSADNRTLVEAASSHGIPVVAAEDLPPMYPTEGMTLIGGAAGGSGLAAALAMSVLDAGAKPAEATLAWTVAGRPLGAGIAVTFPEPVGPLWAGREESPLPWPGVTCLAAPDDTPWRGVRVHLKMADDDGESERIAGIADDGRFLDAVCVAAAARSAAQGAYPPGAGGPGDAGGLFIELARRAGLQIATFVPG